MSLQNGGTTLSTVNYGYDSMSRISSIGSAGVPPGVSATYTRVPGTSLLSSTSISKDSTNVLTVDRSYDSLNRLTSIASLAPLALKSSSYAYNVSDRRTKAIQEDGSFWQYAYDRYGQVASGKKSLASQAVPGHAFEYSYDDIGNFKNEKRNGNVFTYTANNLNQYTQRTVPGTFDISGSAEESAKVAIQESGTGVPPVIPDRLGKYFSKSFTFDNSVSAVSKAYNVFATKKESGQDIVSHEGIDVFLPKTPELFTMDLDGNMLSDGKQNYSWNGENQLVGVESSTGILPVSKVKDECAYDYSSRRISKIVYGWINDAWQLSKTEKYAWNGWKLVGIFNASNQLARSYCWGANGELISDTDCVNNKSYFPCYDGNKNIVGYVDSTGAKVAEYEYDPFGKLIGKSGLLANDFNFRFSSCFNDKESGLYYYGYRYYNPEIRRWLSRDPIEERGGNNIYRITTNDLINNRDYLGLDWKITRNNQPRAYACPETRQDNIHELADKIGLEVNEAFGVNGWLKDEKGNDVFSRAPFKTYTIPNTVVLSLGPAYGDDHLIDVGMIAKFYYGLMNDKFNTTVYTEEYNFGLKLQGSLSSRDVFGWVHSGHGGTNLVMAYYLKSDENYLSHRCRPEDAETGYRNYHEPNPANSRSLFWVKNDYLLMHDALDVAAEVPTH